MIALGLLAWGPASQPASQFVSRQSGGLLATGKAISIYIVLIVPDCVFYMISKKINVLTLPLLPATRETLRPPLVVSLFQRSLLSSERRVLFGLISIFGPRGGARWWSRIVSNGSARLTLSSMPPAFLPSGYCWVSGCVYLTSLELEKLQLVSLMNQPVPFSSCPFVFSPPLLERKARAYYIYKAFILRKDCIVSLTSVNHFHPLTMMIPLALSLYNKAYKQVERLASGEFSRKRLSSLGKLRFNRFLEFYDH